MARTHLNKRQLRFPMDSANRDALSAKLNDHDDALDTLQAAGAIGTTALADGGVTAAKLATGAVTGPKVAAGTFRMLGFTGAAAAGPCTATGVKVGDIVLGLFNVTDDATVAANTFEATITVADQIQQASASNLSTKKYLLFVSANS